MNLILTAAVIVTVFLALVLAGSARGAPRHHHLVLKAHPLEDGRVPLAIEIRRLAALHGLLAPLHRTAITGAEVQGWVTGLIDAFNQPGAVLEREYGEAAQAMATLFDGWFGK